MTISPLAAGFAKTFMLFLTFSLPFAAQAAGDPECDAAFAKSSAAQSCDKRPILIQYAPGSCEIRVACNRGMGYDMVADNVVHRTLKSVPDLVNDKGILRGGVEATPPGAEPVKTVAVTKTDQQCRDEWNRSTASKSCSQVDVGATGDVCTIAAKCKTADGGDHVFMDHFKYDYVAKLVNKNGVLYGAPSVPNPDPDRFDTEDEF